MTYVSKTIRTKESAKSLAIIEIQKPNKR